MNFIVKNGPFVKSKNDKFSIELTILISLIPFLIYKIVGNPLNNFIILLVVMLSTFPISIFIDYLLNKKIDFKKNINDLSYSIIVSILIPINTPYILLFIINIILVIISKFLNFINYKSLLLFIIYFLITFNKDKIIINEYNIYLYLILLLIILFILINKGQLNLE